MMDPGCSSLVSGSGAPMAWKHLKTSARANVGAQRNYCEAAC